MSKILIKHLTNRKFDTFTAHTLVSGKSGSGKSNAAEFIVTQKIKRQKIVDLYDDGRGENAVYSIKETDPKLVKSIFDLSGGKLHPRSFPNEIIMFAGDRLEVINIKQLPSKIKIMSINEKDISIDDLKYLLATTEESRNSLDFLFILLGDISLRELHERLMIQNTKNPDYVKGLGNTKWTIVRNLSKWLNSPLFDIKKYPPINFKKMLENKKITSFSTFLQEDDDVKALIYGLILKKIFYMKRNKVVKQPVTIFLREISNLAGRHKINTNYNLTERFLLKILREGRDYGCTLVCDTQRAIDLLPMMRRQFGIHIAMRQDLKEVMDYLGELQEIDKATLYKIPHLGRGEAIICTGVEYFYPVFFPPTLHHHKREKENILEILR